MAVRLNDRQQRAFGAGAGGRSSSASRRPSHRQAAHSSDKQALWQSSWLFVSDLRSSMVTENTEELPNVLLCCEGVEVDPQPLVKTCSRTVHYCVVYFCLWN